MVKIKSINICDPCVQESEKYIMYKQMWLMPKTITLQLLWLLRAPGYYIWIKADLSTKICTEHTNPGRYMLSDEFYCLVLNRGYPN